MTAKFIKTFKYRCYPLKGAARRANRSMVIRKGIWNAALDERWTRYHQSKVDPDIKPISSYKAQYGHVRKTDHPEFSAEDAQSMQYVLMELDGSFRSYWALHKKGDPDAMPPKEQTFCGHLTYRKSGWSLDGDNLEISNIGRFKLRLHRPIEGRIKTVTVRRKYDKWYVSFACECPLKARPKSRRAVRIWFDDWIFCRDNRGGQFDHPQFHDHYVGDGKCGCFRHPEFYGSEIEELSRLSRSRSRKKRGSRNRGKASRTLAKWHRHIANKRKYYIESIVDHYVKNYGRVSVEELPAKVKIQYAVTSTKARKLCDAGYATFIGMLENKCKEHQIPFTTFKDEEKWQRELATAKEVAELEQALKVWRKARKALKHHNPDRLTRLERDLRRVGILLG